MKSTNTRMSLVAALCLAGMAATSAEAAADQQWDNILTGRAILPADTFSEGPTSGKFIGNKAINGKKAPFVNKQPVQGFSAVLEDLSSGGESFWAMSDNGFGSQENSADYELRIYNITPNFRSKDNKGEGAGSILINRFITLSDPYFYIPFAITNHFTADRKLTGADFDIESFQRMPDGTFYIGDEFGPYLLHVDAHGRVIDAPIALPDLDDKGKDIVSPQNPHLEEGSALRVLNAMRENTVEELKTERKFVAALSHLLLKDGNPDTYVASRKKVGNSGLKPASSEIFDVKALQQAGYPVVVYTVNDTPRMEELLKLGVDGIITDEPAKLFDLALKYDGDKDGKPDFIDQDGLIDPALFSAQGHRGAKALRPENTLPGVEAALDNLMNTIETDLVLTKDKHVILIHEPYVYASKSRKLDGSKYEKKDEIMVKDIDFADLQATFVADKLLPDLKDQTNDLKLSPVSVAFTKAGLIPHAYNHPSLRQFFTFIMYYTQYYKNGPGKDHKDALKRWKNAERVKLNLEIKTNPRSDKDSKGNVFKERTFDSKEISRVIRESLVMWNRPKDVQIQAFDFTPVSLFGSDASFVGDLGFLMGDYPRVDKLGSGSIGSGTNLQDENGENTPWLAGLYWPYRGTDKTIPVKAQRSGGFEGMALDWNTHKLYPLLEKPLTTAKGNTLELREFDPATGKYTEFRKQYPLNKRGKAIGDFIMLKGGKHGLVIERDSTQGDMKGFKAIYKIAITDAELVEKKEILNMVNILDKDEVAVATKQGDVGIGKTFGFPFVTIESVVVLPDNTLGILNDNNYPFSVGRHVGAGAPDDNEFITVKLAEPLED